MAQFGTVITNIGLAKIANAQITQETVGIKHMVLGDGNGAYYTLSQSQTSLKREVWRGMIADEQRDPSNPNRIAFSAYIPSTAGGFTIREVGLLDTAGNLIAVSLYPEQYKPQLAEGVSDDLLLHFVLETSNASVVTLAVDPTIIIASRKYVDDKVAGAIGNIGTNLTELQEQVTTHLDEVASLTKMGHTQLSNATNSIDETKAATPLAVKTVWDRASDAFKAAGQALKEFVIEKFDTPGTYTWTVPEGVSEVYVSGCGGGGGGTGGDASVSGYNSGKSGEISSFGSYLSLAGGGGGTNFLGQPGGLGGLSGGRKDSSSVFVGGQTLYGIVNPYTGEATGYGAGGKGGKSNNFHHSGGGAECCLEKRVSVTPGEQVEIMVGAGGRGGIATGSSSTPGDNGLGGLLIIKYAK